MMCLIKKSFPIIKITCSDHPPHEHTHYNFDQLIFFEDEHAGHHLLHRHLDKLDWVELRRIRWRGRQITSDFAACSQMTVE